MKDIQEAYNYLKQAGFDQAEVGIVLGTGLGGLVHSIDVMLSVDYGEIPNFPSATVESHRGKLIYGKLEGKRVIAMVGRFHYYEGYSMKQITLPIRVMKLLGIQSLLISNAAGGINLDFKKSDIMLIDDHINLLPENPLTGPNLDELGPRFPDMSEPYSRKLGVAVQLVAEQEEIELRSGVYVSVTGPNLETRAEYRYLKIIGADAVGMSTIPEVIVAKHMSIPVCAFSVITDICDPEHLEVVDIQDILAAAAEGEKKLIRLIRGLIQTM